MLKEKVTYVDFNGVERTETLYFHVSKVEATKLMAKYGGDIQKYTNNLVASKDMVGMIDFIEDIILTTYGEKGEDGRTFKKSKEMRDNFANSIAYAEIFEDVLSNPEKASRFVTGSGLVEQNNTKSNPQDHLRVVESDKEE